MNNLLRASKAFLGRNASTILTCIGGAGVIATSVMAVKATPKAIKLLDVAEEEKGEELTIGEKVQVAGSVYIPSILMGASTLACIFGANILNHRKQTALISAYALLDNSYKEYKNKVKELYGEEVESEVIQSIAKDKYAEQDISVSDNKQLFFDYYSGRYFESTMEEVIASEYAVNRTISLTGECSLSTYYEALDIPSVEHGEYLGWSAGGLQMMAWSDWLDFEHEKVVLEDGLECCIIKMSVEPMYECGYY